MISAISKKAVKWLLHSGAISQEDTELFEFASYSLLFSLSPLVLVVVIGAILGMTREGVIMILPFLTIRKFGGGFHLNSPAKCFAFSIILLAGWLLLTKFIVANGYFFSFSILVSLASIQIFLCSPIDSKARRLTERERRMFGKIARIILLVFIALYSTCCLFSYFNFAAFLGSGIILAGLLQIPCFFESSVRND